MPNRQTASVVRRSVPVAVFAIAALSIGIHYFLAASSDPRAFLNTVQTYGFTPAHFTAHGVSAHVPSLLASPLLALFLRGSISHLLTDAVAVLVFGRSVELRLGHGRFLIVFMVCGFFGYLGYCVTDFQSFVPAIGFTGAFMGIAAIDFVLWVSCRPKASAVLGPFLKWALLAVLILSKLRYLGTKESASGVIALSGLAAGLVIGAIVMRASRHPFPPLEVA